MQLALGVPRASFFPFRLHHKSARQIGIYLSTAINTALHGEPSAPDKFSGAAFKK